MEDIHICQSCAMPLVKENDFGSNADLSKNSDYCVHCYQNGAFTQNITMEEMIERCVQFLPEFNKQAKIKITRQQAIEQMREHFPALKRWSGNTENT